MFKKFIITFILLSLLSTYAYAEQRYMPCPIIFVSGIRTNSEISVNNKYSPSYMWPKTLIFNELKKYFSDDTGRFPEYDDAGTMDAGEVSHLEFFFYDARETTLNENAVALKEMIDDLLNTQKSRYYKAGFTYTEPCPVPKVIIIAHSLGGIITRYMLANNTAMHDKVEAVFFLGVPQGGSPVASVGYFLPKEIPYLVEDTKKLEAAKDSLNNQFGKRALTNLIQREKSKIEGNLKFMKWVEENEDKSGFLYTSTRDTNDTAQLRAVLSGSEYWRTLLDALPNVHEKGVIKAALIPDNLANSYRHQFKAYAFNGPMASGIGSKVIRSVPWNGPLSYNIAESDLNGLNTNMGIEKVHAIVGTQNVAIKGYLFDRANKLMGWDNFYSGDYSCIKNGFFNSGDGISNLASQSKIGNIHEINAAHASWQAPLADDPALVGESDHPETFNIILNAIDDPPVIEQPMWVVSADKTANGPDYPVYIVAKVKEYLLADVEFASMTVDGANGDLAEFLNSADGTYKPYYKFGVNKAFLKERPDPNLLDKDNNPITLYPGEFYVKVNLSGDNEHTINLIMKNPAKKESEPRSITVQRPVISNMSPTGTIEDKTPEIKATISSGMGVTLDTASIVMTLDGSPVNLGPLSASSSMTVTYTPGNELSEGNHTVTLNGRDINGLPAQGETWTFTIETPEPPIGHFVVSIPPKIAIDQDFTMQVTAYTADGQVMDGQEGRPLYAEGANITISGDPAPQGSLAFTHINSGGWVNGIWEITNQKYSNSTEEKYKLTITVTDSGGDYAEMTGSADTIVGPLELILQGIGSWDVNRTTGNWEGFHEEGVSINSQPFCAGGYRDTNLWGGIKEYGPRGWPRVAYSYKIEIPPGSQINNIEISLNRQDIGNNQSRVFKSVSYILYNQGGARPDAYPPNVAAEVNIDYSFNSPVGTLSPIGEYNFLHEVIGGEFSSTEGYRSFYEQSAGWKTISSTLHLETIVKSIPVNDPAIRTVWLSVYPANVQSMVAQIAPHAIATLYDKTEGYYWDITIQAIYDVNHIYGYK